MSWSTKVPAELIANSEIQVLREQLATCETDRQLQLELKTTYMRELNEAEVKLAASQKREVMLREAITWIQVRCAGNAMPNWENTPNTGNSRGLILDVTNAALAATEAELGGLIVCEKSSGRLVKSHISALPDEWYFHAARRPE